MKLLCILLFLSIQYVACQNGYKFCVSESDSVSQKCQAILKGNSQVSCVSVIDSADCALKLIDKKVDFGVFSAEDALFIASLINDKVNVIGELRHKERLNETYSFQTAVVVRHNHNGGFEGLRSTNYCHPGFGDGQFWTDRVLKEFESIVVPRNCNNNKSTTESEIASLSDFFKSACRPGQWAYEDLLDKKLKKKYWSLCALCDSPGRCSYNDNYQGSQGETLQCLTKNDGGDVAYAALEDVQKYFGLLPYNEPRANPNDYKFLCKDKSYQPLRNPCTWINQRWPLVIALKEKAAALKSSILNDFLCKRNECRGKWQEAFTLLLENTDQAFTPVSSKDDNLLKFVGDARPIPRERDGDPCKDKSVRLCTVNTAEFVKCSWLKQVVISQGIEPKLNCVPGYTMWSCFDLIKKNQADIIGIDTDYTFIAKNTFNLSAVMYQDSNNNDAFFLIVPIIKANSSMKSLADFKNKRISFPEFDGLAWNTFVTVTKAYSVLPKKCPYISAVSSFVKGACAPGVQDMNHKYFNSTVPENICSLCTKVTNNNNTGECSANSSNKYFGDIGALRLLLEDLSDVAVVDYRRLFEKENVFRLDFNRSLYSVLCKDGSLKPLGGYGEIGTECAWSFGVAAEIISRSSIKKSERRDITELLLKIDDRFGAILSSWDNPIMMYRPFNGTAGLIFKESTVDLVPINNEITHIASLVELKSKSFEECHEWKSSAISHAHAPTAYLLVLLMFYHFLS